MYDLLCSVLTMSRARCVPVDPYINQTVSDYRYVVKLVPTLCQEPGYILGKNHVGKYNIDSATWLERHLTCFTSYTIGEALGIYWPISFSVVISKTICLFVPG